MQEEHHLPTTTSTAIAQCRHRLPIKGRPRGRVLHVWAYTGSRLCHLPRSLIKRQPNTLRGDEVQPAWWPPLRSWLHRKDWPPVGMWTAGKYGGPRSGPAALVLKGQFCGSSTSPDEHVALLAFCFRPSVRHLDLCQVSIYCACRQRLDSALSGVLTASSWPSGAQY